MTVGRRMAGALTGAAVLLAVASAATPEAFVAKLRDGSYVATVDGKTGNVRFALGEEYRVAGKGFGNTVNAFILGNKAGGSMLEIVSQSDEGLVVRVSAVPAADSPWPAGLANGDPEGFVTLKIIADGGGRIFFARLPGAWYACKAGEPNCK